MFANMRDMRAAAGVAGKSAIDLRTSHEPQVSRRTVAG
jgi:hypothetical protein